PRPTPKAKTTRVSAHEATAPAVTAAQDTPATAGSPVSARGSITTVSIMALSQPGKNLFRCCDNVQPKKWFRPSNRSSLLREPQVTPARPQHVRNRYGQANDIARDVGDAAIATPKMLIRTA